MLFLTTRNRAHTCWWVTDPLSVASTPRCLGRDSLPQISARSSLQWRLTLEMRSFSNNKSTSSDVSLLSCLPHGGECDGVRVWRRLGVTMNQCDNDSVWQRLSVTEAQCDSDTMWHLSLSSSIYIPHLNSSRAIYIRPEAQIKFPLWATKVCQHPHCYDFELPERQRMPPNICCGQERQLAEGDTYSEEAESVVCTTAISILCLDIWQYGGALRPVRVSATRLLRRDRLHGLPHLLWRQSAARCRISQSTVRSQREIRLTGQ